MAMTESDFVPEASEEVLNLKPRKGSFMRRRVLMGAVVSLVLGFGVGVALEMSGFSPVPAILAVPVLLAFFCCAALVAYRKERYEIHGDRVICHKGGLFGDETTELELRNVTHLKIMLPWLRYKFFGIGNVMVESAGSSEPIVMLVLADPKGVYEELRRRMGRNGFDLKQDELLHEERPAMVGVVFEALGVLGSTFFAGVVFIVLWQLLPEDSETQDWFSFLYDAVEILVLISLVVFAVLRALDVRRRTYRVFNDVVVYEEGFLTRNNALIPYENIADASTKRTLVDHIFGMFDVTISCQGGGSEIRFRHLKRGDELSATIDTLVSNASRKPKWKPQRKAAAEQRPTREKPSYVHDGPLITGDFKMNDGRVFLPALLLLPLFPIFVVVMIGLVIRKCCTTYSLKEDSVRYHFSFLNTNTREFAYDKVTGVVVKRNLLDQMMGTMSLKFWSIGSSQAIEFQYLKQSDIDLKALLGQLGVPPADAEPCKIPAHFCPATWLKANLKHLPGIALSVILMVALFIAIDSIALLLIMLVSLVITVTVSYIHGMLYYSRQQLLFYPHHVELIQGLLTTSHYHACYHNIKRRRVTCYPGTGAGSLEIFVAGEQMMGSSGSQESGKKGGVVRQCSFTSGFLTDATEAGELLDDVLCGRVEPQPGAVSAGPMEELLEAPRAVKNTVLSTVLVSVILFPLLVLLPLSLAYYCITIRKWRYSMDAVRIIIERGVFYKTRETTLLDRVDSLQQKQGPIHKLCGNGDVSIMTAGSSKPDLCIVNCPDYRRVYEMIREHSQ